MDNNACPWSCWNPSSTQRVSDVSDSGFCDFLECAEYWWCGGRLGRKEGVRAKIKVSKLTDILIQWTMGHSTINKCGRGRWNTGGCWPQKGGIWWQWQKQHYNDNDNGDGDNHHHGNGDGNCDSDWGIFPPFFFCNRGMKYAFEIMTEPTHHAAVVIAVVVTSSSALATIAVSLDYQSVAI